MSKQMETSSQSASGSDSAGKQHVSFSTHQKQKTELEKDFQTISWLDCEMSGVGVKKTVVKLKCTVCMNFESKIEGRRNYSENGSQEQNLSILATSMITLIQNSMPMLWYFLKKTKLKLRVSQQLHMLQQQRNFLEIIETDCFVSDQFYIRPIL